MVWNKVLTITSAQLSSSHTNNNLRKKKKVVHYSKVFLLVYAKIRFANFTLLFAASFDHICTCGLHFTKAGKGRIGKQYCFMSFPQNTFGSKKADIQLQKFRKIHLTKFS